MDLLVIVLFIGLSIISSAGKSKKAKQQRDQRMRNMQNPPTRPVNTDTRNTAQRRTASQEANARKKAVAEEMQRAKRAAEKTAAQKQVAQKQTQQKKAKAGSGKKQGEFDWREFLTGQPDQKKQPQGKPMTQSASQTRKTLIEQKPDCEAHRPDREEREHSNHEKVTASVKPISASVKPLRNVYDNAEDCEHRIELNPNIQYQHRRAEEGAQKKVAIQTDSDSLLQGVIWSEILGKPKAYQRGHSYRR